MGPARSIPEVHVLVEQLHQTQVLGQRGWQHEPGVGHQMVVVEGHLTPVEAVAKSHRESAFLVWVWAVSATTIFPFQKGVFADTRRPTTS
jgi:NADPH-dependent glutamate synthase beta subunit-like oxidoreductase